MIKSLFLERFCEAVNSSLDRFLGTKAFRFKDCIPKEIHLVSFINFNVDSAMNPIMVNAQDTLM